jgi:hypothetical protein
VLQIAVEQPVEDRRALGNEPPVAVAPLAQLGEPIGGHAVPAELVGRCCQRVPAVLVAYRVRGQELGVGHRHRRVEAGRKPCRIADVIGMAVSR